MIAFAAFLLLFTNCPHTHAFALPANVLTLPPQYNVTATDSTVDVSEAYFNSSALLYVEPPQSTPEIFLQSQ